MTSAISNMFSLREPQHERLPTDEDASQNSIIVEDDDVEAAAGSGVGASSSTTTTNSNSNNSNPSGSSGSSSGDVPELVAETVESDNDDDEESADLTTVDVEAGDGAAAATAAPRASGLRAANTVTLSELEEERELARRRTSACVLLAVFVLFRLWIEALRNGDVFIMMLCLFGTSWTARLIRHNREHEEALDERIRVYLENADPNTTEIDRNGLRFLSFQAQLALAMMESQRQMQQGGYGHPDGPGGGAAGVSDDAKSKWQHFSWKEGVEQGDPSAAIKTTKGGYGSVAQSDGGGVAGGLEEDGPHCSICLGEYEEGEKLVQLPCGHIYHEDCVGSWTTNHTRCPLCNLDLESVTSASSSTEGAQSLPEASMV